MAKEKETLEQRLENEFEKFYRDPKKKYKVTGVPFREKKLSITYICRFVDEKNGLETDREGYIYYKTLFTNVGALYMFKDFKSPKPRKPNMKTKFKYWVTSSPKRRAELNILMTTMYYIIFPILLVALIGVGSVLYFFE
ncbi:MAG: hypothetical protein ATN35_12490 [Epulopiscium sp. Nele67-Bin004]|nr:MAG: hypothetical protein ATN35_12490 [Epulopiscium sp. Nele67-Bin004]